jgi:probable rRNA maturation factor
VAPAPDGDRGRRLYVGPWRIDLISRDGVARVLSDQAIARSASAALEKAAASFAPASLAIVLTDDAELGDLNAAHLGKRGPTDVLSFPLLPPEAFTGRQGGRPARRVRGSEPPRRGRVHLGDIAISVERAIAQAESGAGGQTGDVRWSPAEELRLLVTHGALHICGWDHAEPDDEAAMRALEGRLLAAGANRT